jgi:LemA protein
MQARLENEGYTPEEYAEVVRRAQRIRAEREGRLSRDLLEESAAEVGIGQEELREAEEQLRKEKAEQEHRLREQAGVRQQRQSFAKMAATAAAIILALFLTFSYNALNGGRAAALRAKSDLQAVLQRRADLVPQVASMAREGVAAEKGLHNDLERVRADLQSGNLPRQLQADQELRELLKSDRTVLHSPELYRDLLTQIEGSENRISVARQRYSAAAQRYNETAQGLPTKLVRPLFGFPAEMPYFEAKGSVEAPPRL